MGLENSLELAMLNPYLFLNQQNLLVVFLTAIWMMVLPKSSFPLYDDWAAIISSRWIVITSWTRIARGCIYKGPKLLVLFFVCLGQCHPLSTVFGVLCTCPIAFRMRFKTYFAGCRNRKRGICILFAVLCTCKSPFLMLFVSLCTCERPFYLVLKYFLRETCVQRLLGFCVVVYFALHFACYCNSKYLEKSCSHLKTCQYGASIWYIIFVFLRVSTFSYAVSTISFMLWSTNPILLHFWKLIWYKMFFCSTVCW